MIPVVALIGRPNVGKSTLFNRLTRTKNALVADVPGLTRDRKYGLAEWQGYQFIVIDTGGINVNIIGLNTRKKDIDILIIEQLMMAIEEADIVLFMVDGRTGLISSEQGIAKYLRNFKKKIILVVNKTDGIDADTAISDFYALGMYNIVSIDAFHGRGINIILEQILLQLIELYPDNQADYQFRKQEHCDQQSLAIKLAIVGRPNVGKSTLINRILGKDRVLVYDIPGTTRDSIYIPMVRENQEYVVIDTAGLPNRSKSTETVKNVSSLKTFQAIQDANVVLLVLDARTGIVDQDLSLLSFILNSGRSLVVTVNKWDSLSKEKRDNVKQVLDHRLVFIDFYRVHFISALYGIGISHLFTSINEAYQCSTKCINTASLTRIMRMAVNEHQPPIVRGRRVKPKYAHLGGYQPLLVVIHGTQVKDMPDSYKRYLINYFRRSLDIIGTPIRIKFNESPNPFSSRHNTLTPAQRRKRKRLMTYIKK